MIELIQARADDRLTAFTLFVDGEEAGFCKIWRRPSQAP
jgi:hypothetical protein